MKKLYSTSLLLMLTLIASISAQAEDIVYDFSSAIPSDWTTAMTPNGFEDRGAQFIVSGTLTLKGVKDASKVVILCSCNNATEGQNTIGVSVAGKDWGTENLKKETDVEKTFSGATASGDLVISLTRGAKSIYIKTVTVTCGSTTGGGEGEGGGEDTPATELDPNYTYAEPTVVSTPGAVGNNMPYEFVKNNIKVTCSTGAVTDTYFGCNAGAALTFTATKAIKGISIDGYVKKGFDVTVSAGNVEFLSDDETEIEDDPVVVITDINAKTVTLNCVKQLRCYNVRFYFEGNPEEEISGGGTGGGEEGDYTYDYEPTEATTLNLTFDDMEYADYTDYLGYAYTDLYFVSDEYEMELGVFSPAVSGTALATGTYEVTSDYADGTIQASPGGDAEYDYPSCIYADFEYDEEYEAWFYNAAYYIVSGTLTVANDPAGVKMTLKGKTYYGSTVNATFVGKPVNANGEEEEGIATTKTDDNIQGVVKQIRSNQIIIRQGRHTFDLQGRKM